MKFCQQICIVLLVIGIFSACAASPFVEKAENKPGGYSVAPVELAITDVLYEANDATSNYMGRLQTLLVAGLACQKAGYSHWQFLPNRTIEFDANGETWWSYSGLAYCLQNNGKKLFLGKVQGPEMLKRLSMEVGVSKI